MTYMVNDANTISNIDWIKDIIIAVSTLILMYLSARWTSIRAFESIDNSTNKAVSILETSFTENTKALMSMTQTLREYMLTNDQRIQIINDRVDMIHAIALRNNSYVFGQGTIAEFDITHLKNRKSTYLTQIILEKMKEMNIQEKEINKDNGKDDKL